MSADCAVQDKDASRDPDGEAFPPKSSGTMTLHNGDDGDAASPLTDEPGRAASQRSSGRDEEKPAANNSRAPARTLVLKVQKQEDMPSCLAAVDGDRLASGSWYESIIIWDLAEGTQIHKLDGHTEGVDCLAALDDGGRLASGSDSDSSVIIWNLADGAQLVKLEGHTEGVDCLAALDDGGRLASGGSDKYIIIWDLASEEPLAKKLEGHTDKVRCLAVLDGARLASGSYDESIIIWNLTDGTELHKLEGHTDSVICLAALADGRLASGGTSEDGIFIWNLADGTQIAKLDARGPLAALDGGLLASLSWTVPGSPGSMLIWNLADYTQLAKMDAWGPLAALDGDRLVSCGEGTIRIRPVLHSAAYKFAVCGSAFEFEEVARACHKDDRLGDLFDAVTVVQQSDEKLVKLSVDDEITTQASVFDAIAKVVNEEKDADRLASVLTPSPREKSINSLTPRVLDLVHDEDLLPNMKRRGVSNAAIQELAPSPLFRVVLDAKFNAGPKFVLYLELFLFAVLGCCFTRIASFEVLGVSKWFAAEKILEIVVAFVILAYFSGRELYQMASTRAMELATAENPIFRISYDMGANLRANEVLPRFKWKGEGLAFYALLIPRLLVLFVVCLLFLPVLLVFIGLCCAGLKDEWIKAFAGDPEDYDDGGWFGKQIGIPILHDPLTFLGLSKAWRYDYWNWVDAATIGCALAAFARAAMPGGRLSADLAVATSILMWIRFCWYLKNLRLGWAKFVLMIEQIAWDLREYLLFFLVVLMMFASAFYLYIGPRKSAEFGFHDDGAPNAYRNFGYTVYNLILLGFVGDFDADNFDKVVLRVLLVFYIIVVIVVFLNVLIAIVSDSYDLSMAKAEALYYRSRLELITETAPIASRLPQWMLPDYDAKEQGDWDDIAMEHIIIQQARLKKMITDALDDAKTDKADDPNRLNYTINAVEAIVDNRARTTESRIDAMEKKIDNLTAMIQKLLDDKEQS